MHGRMVVFEGIDGSGKSTQVDLLLNYLKNKRKKFSYYKFPQYEATFHGKTVAKFLRGELGSINQVNPYLISLAYALDRASVKDAIYRDLNKGKLVICDRYVSASRAHHGAKFSAAKRKEFLKWLDELEYDIDQMPVEDLTLLLDIPVNVSFNLQKNKKKDIHEADSAYMEEVREVYLNLAKRDKHWVVVNTVEDDQLRSPESIHQEILSILKNRHYI
ncbi:MAG TPA: dTMP kinase [Candidatus Nanoarchaeia archaeon]|nr:thymidylate kinase [uncultured archaeon]